MGLDMYLYKKTYVGAHYKHNQAKGVVDITVGEENCRIPVQLDRINSIDELFGYWRKANAIHKWFIEKCADGVDECQRIDISREKMCELLSVVETVIANPEKAQELLPVGSGFFFGSDQYDTWYFKDLEATKEILDTALESGERYGYFYYQASW